MADPGELGDDLTVLRHKRERILVRLVTAISRACIAFGTRSSGDFGISLSQALVLGELFSQNGCCQEDLRAYIGLDKGNITRALQRLEELGMVQRLQDAEDRRQVRVYLARKALAIEKKMAALANIWDQRLTEGFTDEERETLVRLLMRMEANARVMAGNDEAGRTACVTEIQE